MAPDLWCLVRRCSLHRPPYSSPFRFFFYTIKTSNWTLQGVLESYYPLQAFTALQFHSLSGQYPGGWGEGLKPLT